MDQLRIAVDDVVSAGIRAYIGLLGRGEKTRSRLIFSDALQLSAVVAGGPSSRISPVFTAGNRAPSMVACAGLLTLRSLLASLLVLKTTGFWSRVPALAELQDCCLRVATCFGVTDGAGSDVAGSGYTSGGSAAELTFTVVPGSDPAHGRRRNDALPVVPEISR